MIAPIFANREFSKYPQEVHLGYKDEAIKRDDFFLSYVADILDKHVARVASPRILEWGTGFSTFVFYDYISLHGRGRLISIDNNKQYQEAFLSHLGGEDFFSPVIRNEVGPTQSFNDKGLHYASHAILETEPFHLIFIDGRRRMECMLNSLMVCNEDTCVVVDDGLRTRYLITELFFDVSEVMGHGVVYKIKRQILDALKDDISLLREKIASTLRK